MYSVLKLGNYLGGYANNPVSFIDDYSVLLDGVDEYINIDNLQSAISTNTTGTISMWIKPVDATPAAVATIISVNDTDAETGLGVFLLTDGIIRINVEQTGTKSWEFDTDSALLSDNTWHHFALVHNGTTPLLYIDGSLAAITFGVTTDKTVWFNDYAGLDNARIGCRNYNSEGNSIFFNGNINEFIYTSDAKNASAVSDIYNSGTPKDESAISNGVTYYTFEHASDNYNSDVVNEWRFYDSIGSNNADSVNLEEADRELDTP